MFERPNYIYFKDEKEDKISEKLFKKFVVIVLVFYIFIFLFGYLFYQNYAYITISGQSMQNTLNPNPVAVQTERGIEMLQDGVYINLKQTPTYNDIVVIDISSVSFLNKETIIKRVIALENDYVTIIRDSEKNEYRVLRIKNNTNNIELLEEDYVKSYSEWSGSYFDNDIIINGISYERSFYTTFSEYYQVTTFNYNGNDVLFFKVPQSNFFFLGDNRANSSDSRGIGTLPISNVKGTVVEIVSNGTQYNGNNIWWLKRFEGFFKVVWREILIFFGANV